MNLDILAAIAGALASITALGATALSRDLLRRLLGLPKEAEKPYAERLAELTSSLTPRVTGSRFGPSRSRAGRT